MPYKRIGMTIYTKASGKWKKKQTARNIISAKKALQLLRGIEHSPSFRKKVRKRAKRKT